MGDRATRSIIVNATREHPENGPEYESGKSAMRKSLEKVYRHVGRG